MRGRSIAAAGAALALLTLGGVAYAATTTPTATCTANPAITDGTTTQSIRVTCSWPKPVPVTSTVTSTVTVTASPTSSTTPAPVTSTTAPVATTTTAAPTVTAAAPAGAFPDASTTGVPAGTVLRKVPGDVTSGPGWEYDTRGWVNIWGTDAGVVVSGLDFTVNVNIHDQNVTLKNSRITVKGDTWAVGLQHARNAVIDHLTITAPAQFGPDRMGVAIKDVYGDSQNTKITANDISHAGTAVQTHEGLVADNYLHDFGLNTGDHVNGVTSNGDNTPMTIRHNTILNQHTQTDCIGLFEDFGAEGNRVVENNLLAGGGYSVYGGQNPGGPTASGIVIRNNVFDRRYFPTGGYYGPLTAFNTTAAGNSFTGNTWEDGTPVN